MTKIFLEYLGMTKLCRMITVRCFFSLFSVLVSLTQLVSNDGYLQNPYTNESTALSNSRKESGNEILVEYSICIICNFENPISRNDVIMTS